MSDITYKDAWDFDKAVDLLTSIATRYEKAGDYSTATQVSNIIWWMEDAGEALCEARQAIGDLADARRALYRVPS